MNSWRFTRNFPGATPLAILALVFQKNNVTKRINAIKLSFFMRATIFEAKVFARKNFCFERIAPARDNDS
ncbi:MAG: hypothetical protein DRR19_27105 [Candidatus Parabeggiatoa sp. nov. 1]|nr:MAG: hypothetical protein DRR19_27105 [Gammaproteobacteria bacterium]